MLLLLLPTFLALHTGCVYAAMIKQCADARAIREGNCYTLPDHPLKLNYTQAQAYCKSQGAELGVLDNREKNLLVSQLITWRQASIYLDLQLPPAYSYLYLAQYGLDIRDRTNVTFRALTCSDLHIALSKEENNNQTNTYEIVIGGWGNTASAIRRSLQGTELVKVAHHPNDCRHSRPHWVSWAGGRIALGDGLVVGEGEVVSYQDPHPYDVNYLAVSGWGHSPAIFAIHDGVHTNLGAFWVRTSAEAAQGTNSSSGTGLGERRVAAHRHPVWCPQVCMAIERVAGDTEHFQWRTEDCSQHLSFICEFHARSHTLVG